MDAVDRCCSAEYPSRGADDSSCRCLTATGSTSRPQQIASHCYAKATRVLSGPHACYRTQGRPAPRLHSFALKVRP